MDRRGFSFLEIVLSVGLMAVIATVGYVSLNRTRNTYVLKNTGQVLSSMLRQAQQSALTNASSSAWGVRFDNTTTTSATAYLFASSTYSTSSVKSTYTFNPRVIYATSSIAAGTKKDVVFSRQTGYPATSTTIVILPTTGTGTVTLSVSAIGVIQVSGEPIPLPPFAFAPRCTSLGS